MEKYKGIVRKRIRSIIIFTVIVLVVVLYMQLFFPKMEEGVHGAPFSLLVGFVVGLNAVALGYLAKMSFAINNNEILRKMYNTERDERVQMIKQKAGIPAMTVGALFLVVAGIVSGYIHAVIFYTLLASGLFLLLYQAGLKFYYMKKY